MDALGSDAGDDPGQRPVRRSGPLCSDTRSNVVERPPDFDTELRTGDGLYTNSVIAIDAATGRILGYQVTQQIEVRTGDVDKVASLAGDLGGLLDQGVPVVGQAPEYLYAKLPEIRGPLLADATRDAKARAAEIVNAVGADVGRIKAVRVGVFQITKRNSTEVNDYGMYDTSDREKEITAVVRVTFALD